MLIDQLIHKHLEQLWFGPNDRYEIRSSSARSPGSQIDWLLTLKVNVAVLELFQKMLIDQVIHKHLERSGLDQTTGMDSIRHQPDLQVLKWIGLLTWLE